MPHHTVLTERRGLLTKLEGYVGLIQLEMDQFRGLEYDRNRNAMQALSSVGRLPAMQSIESCPESRERSPTRTAAS